MIRSGRWLSIAAAIVIGIGAVVTSAMPVAAAKVPDQLRDTAVVTYELVPARHVIHVTFVLTMTNKALSTTRNRTCTQWAFDPYFGWFQYSAVCVWRTDYYYNSYTPWIEADARSVKATANGGSVSTKLQKVSGNWRQVKISFSPLYYGKTRRITLTYDLPGSGPRGSMARSAGTAFAAFCAAGPGTESAEVRVVLPAGYLPTFSPDLRQIGGKGGGKLVFTSGRLSKAPWTFRSCVSGDNPKGFTTTPVQPAGGPVAGVEAWKDDPQWASAASTAAKDAQELAAVLGDQPDGGGITIRETRAITAPVRAYDPAKHSITLGEYVTSAATVDDEVAGTWFPLDTFATSWIKGGYVRWAEYTAGIAGAGCPSGMKPDPALDLTTWSIARLASSPAARDSVEAKTQAACSIIRAIADAIGPDRMRSTLAAMRDGEDGWSQESAPAKRPTKAITWASWLDIVTERGLVPTGADPDLAASLLLSWGIVSDKAQVDAHRAARDAVAKLATLTGGKLPAPVGPALTSGDLVAARAAMDAATQAWTAVAAIPTTLPGVIVDGGPVQQAVVAAETQADLDAAVALAGQQAALAKDVADALAAEAAPRDTFQQIGLMGVTLPADATAVGAVSTVDAATAGSTANTIRTAIAGARDAGTGRVTMVVVVVVVVVLFALLALVFILRRRRRVGPAGGPALATSAAPVGAAGPLPALPPPPVVPGAPASFEPPAPPPA